MAPNFFADNQSLLVSGSIERAQIETGRRYRQVRDLWTTEGLGGIVDRVRRTAAQWLNPKSAIWPVERADVLAADLSHPPQMRVPKIEPGQRAAVNWVTIPAASGSGGHTTLFRIMRYLEKHGYKNRLYLYNVYRADIRYYQSIVRHSYKFEGPVSDVMEGMEDAHAVVATSWPSAYPVFNSRCSGKRFYFVQDFEPSFHPTGALSLLAENTYRMGFHAVTAGRWLASKLKSEYGMRADSFEFGSDTASYHRINGTRRSGIVFYARPEAARRGFELGLMALEIVARHHPDLKFHLYGAKVGKLPFRFIDHGRVTPDELNQIYNSCYAGLSLSLTNVSLVPHEMLAAGCIPVVNDADHNRIVLNNPYVRYAAPHPNALAEALESLLAMSEFETISQGASESVRSTTWEEAGATVDAILQRVISESTT